MYNLLIQKAVDNVNLDQCQIFDKVPFSGIGREILSVLVSPICDLAHDDVDHYLFCAILPYKQLFLQTIINEGEVTIEELKAPDASRGKKNLGLKPIKLIVGNRLERFHWLGKLPNKDGYWYVDYQLVQSIHRDKLSDINNMRIYVVNSPLRESIFVRFSNYMGRIGLPVETEERETEANEVLESMVMV